MKERHRCLKGMLMLLVFTSLGALTAAQSKEKPDPASETSRFDFSIFFTGNIQGNIEPCG